MENKVLENLEQLKKMLVLLSADRKIVLSHRKTFEHVEEMRAIVNESIEEVSKSWKLTNTNVLKLMLQTT